MEKIEHCKLCGSLCRVVTDKEGASSYRPFIERAGTDDARKKVVSMLSTAKFCEDRLHLALSTLTHVQDFLQSKGHKIMHLRVKETIRHITEME